jgi:pimeloyl-ACP methyl ester carboxylesterase
LYFAVNANVVHLFPNNSPERHYALRSFRSAMLDLLDLLLLRRGIPSDDWTLTFRRIEGTARSTAIYFLPWHTPLYLARHFGFVPLEFLACYEMPPAIVSSTPELSVTAAKNLVTDAEDLLRYRGVAPGDALVIGLSVGTYPATLLANRIGARLCAIAGADRADLMLWQSPAARLVKRRCLLRGVDLQQYSDAMKGLHPVQNLSGIAPGSMFIVGERDPFVPLRRRRGLVRAIRWRAPRARVVTLAAGHVKTMIASAHYQRELAGIERTRAWWHASRALPSLQASFRATD